MVLSGAKWDGRVVTTCPFNEVLNTNASLSGWGAALKGSSTTSTGWWKQPYQQAGAQGSPPHHQVPPSPPQGEISPPPVQQHDCHHIHQAPGQPQQGNEPHYTQYLQHHSILLSAIHLLGVENNHANYLSQLYPQHK